jgi:hypothetical protein
MKPHTRKLYQLVRAKLHLGEQDGMKFIHGIQEEEIHISFNCVIRAIDQMERELIRWMFIFWVGQGAVTYMIVSLLKN